MFGQNMSFGEGLRECVVISCASKSDRRYLTSAESSSSSRQLEFFNNKFLTIEMALTFASFDNEDPRSTVKDLGAFLEFETSPSWFEDLFDAAAAADGSTATARAVQLDYVPKSASLSTLKFMVLGGGGILSAAILGICGYNGMNKKRERKAAFKQRSEDQWGPPVYALAEREEERGPPVYAIGESGMLVVSSWKADTRL
jgi:hypothetical protein